MSSAASRQSLSEDARQKQPRARARHRCDCFLNASPPLWSRRCHFRARLGPALSLSPLTETAAAWPPPSPGPTRPSTHAAAQNPTSTPRTTTGSLISCERGASRRYKIDEPSARRAEKKPSGGEAEKQETRGGRNPRPARRPGEEPVLVEGHEVAARARRPTRRRMRSPGTS